MNSSSLSTSSSALSSAGPMQQLQHGNFHFTAVGLNRIATDSVAVVTVVVDISGSVESYRTELEKCLDAIVEACKLSPNHDTLHIRVVTFNSTVHELRGFLPLADHTTFVGTLQPDGLTALVDGILDGLSGMQGYAKTLRASDYLSNGTLVCITDGMGNTGKCQDPAAVRALIMQMIETDRTLESLQTILVAVNAGQFSKELHDFQAAAGFNQFVDLSDASARKLAKLAQFVSKSISSSSQALGTGAAAAPVNPAALVI